MKITKIKTNQKNDAPVTIQKALLIAAGFAAVGLLVFFTSRESDTAKDGYLLRGDYGSTDVKENLQAEVDGKTTDIEIDVGARKYTGSEVSRYLDEAVRILPSTVLADQAEDHITADLSLVTTLPDSPVRISWMVIPPDMVDEEGKLGDKIPDTGCAVKAEATLTLQDEVRTQVLSLTVFPKILTEEEALEKKIKAEVNKEDESGEKLLLPEKVDGRKITWSSKDGKSGQLIAALGIIAALLYLYSGKKKMTDAENKRKGQLLLDYPHIISKLILLINAGMSMRSAFEKMAADYHTSRCKGRPARAGYEEIVRMSEETGHGVPEAEAYHEFGERCGLVKYRTFSVLLIQNLKSGSHELIMLLQQEAADAFEERKKQARILGEEAGTKLLFPMMLMLLVVMLILMVPAFLSF